MKLKGTVISVEFLRAGASVTINVPHSGTMTFKGLEQEEAKVYQAGQEVTIDLTVLTAVKVKAEATEEFIDPAGWGDDAGEGD